MKTFNNISLLSFFAAVFLLVSCDKTKPYDVVIPPSQVHFIGERTQIYATNQDPVPVYNVIVGTTDVSDVDRLATFHITSTSGATEGEHYTLPEGNTITIKADSVFGYIPLQAIAAAYS